MRQSLFEWVKRHYEPSQYCFRELAIAEMEIYRDACRRHRIAGLLFSFRIRLFRHGVVFAIGL